MLDYPHCLKCALVKAGYRGVDQMTNEKIDDEYRQLKKREQEKEKKAKEDKEKLMWKRFVWEKEQETRKKREEEKKKEQEQLKKKRALHTHDSPANYPAPTATSSYRPRKSTGVKTDIGQQGYQDPNMGRGTAGLPHRVFSPTSRAAMARPPNASRATTSKTPLMKQLSNRNPPPGRR